MKRIHAVLLVATVAAAVPARSQAQDEMAAPTTQESQQFVGSAATSPSTFNGFDQYRQMPDLGAPGSAAHGLLHFSGPLHRFSTWYRPRAATLTRYQRCAPDPFRPRGFGHLFARPCDGYRMEYSPYQLVDSRSQYGPAYLARMPDPRCEHCDPTVKDKKYRKHKKDQCDQCR